MATYGTWAVSDSGRNEEDDARPEHLEWAHNVQSGRPGWLLADYASDIVSAEELLDAARLQQELASADDSRWVSVLDSGDDRGRAYIVFEPQEVALWRLIEMRERPTPAELAALAIGVVSALEQLRARFGREHGQLGWETVFLSKGENGPDCSAPRLNELSPAALLGQRRSWETDTHSLGTLLYQYVKGDSDFSVECRKLPDENPFWPEESGKQNRRWRQLLGDLLAGKYDQRPLADLRRDLESLREQSPLPVVAIIAAVAVVAAASFIAKQNFNRSTPSKTNETAGLATNTNVKPNTNETVPPPTLLLPINTVTALKEAVKFRRSFGALTTAVEELPDTDLTKTDQFVALKEAVTNWWGDATWKPPIPKAVPELLSNACTRELTQTSAVPACDDNIAKVLKEEWVRRETLKTTTTNLIVTWNAATNRLGQEPALLSWENIGLYSNIWGIVDHQFSAYLNTKFANLNLSNLTQRLAEEPAKFLQSMPVPPLTNELYSAFTNQLPTNVQSSLKGAFPTTISGLNNWFRQVAVSNDLYLPGFTYSPTNFPSAKPNAPKFEDQYNATSNTLRMLLVANVADIEPPLATLKKTEEKLEADRSNLVSRAKVGRIHRPSFETNHFNLVFDLNKWESAVSNALKSSISKLQKLFDSSDESEFPAILKQVEALPSSDAQKNLIAYVSGGTQRLSKLKEFLEKGDYEKLTPEEFRPYGEQTDFKSLLELAKSEKQVLEKITQLIATDWEQADLLFQKLDSALKQKPPFVTIGNQLKDKRPVAVVLNPNPPATTTSPPVTVTAPTNTDLKPSAVTPSAITPKEVLKKLEAILADKSLGQKGARFFLDEIKKRLGAAATQGQWPETLRQMESRINNYTNGV